MANRDEVYQWIDKHYRANYEGQVKAANRLTSNWHAAEDIVQTAYERCCRYWQAFDEAVDLDRMFPTFVLNCFRDWTADELYHSSDELPVEDILVLDNNLYLETVKAEIKDMIYEQPEYHRPILYYHLIMGFPLEDVDKMVTVRKRQCERIVADFLEQVRDRYGEAIAKASDVRHRDERTA